MFTKSASGVKGAAYAVPSPAFHAVSRCSMTGSTMVLGSMGFLSLGPYLTPVKLHLHLSCVKYARADPRQRPRSDRGHTRPRAVDVRARTRDGHLAAGPVPPLPRASVAPPRP